MATFKTRAYFLVFFLAAAFAVIIARLFVIQVLEGSVYAAQSRKQTQQRTMVAAKRGDILDRKGRVLATSVESRVKLSVSALSERPDNLAPEENTGGFVDIKRMYPYGEMAGAVLGYIGKDGGGLGGAEFEFDRFLKGENGWAILNRDGRNNTYAKIGLPSKAPENGNDVYLTIDIDIQKIAENALAQAVENLGACGGMCVVMEPSSGKILAMAGRPLFNPNVAERFPAGQRLNKCVNYTYEPGSTFKAVTAACALQENVLKETDTLDGNRGCYEIFNEKIHDEKPYGKLTFAEAFKYSSNVCFAKAANGIGNERLYNYTKDFGFGAPTGVQLPGEELGIVHPMEKWSGRTRVTMAIGQEISVTVLQMAMLYACVANDGVLVEPRIFEKITGKDMAVVSSSSYKPIRRVVSAQTAKRLRAMMCGVVSGGTGMKAAIAGITVGGKTGTAQKIDKLTGAYSEKKGWSSFIGFLPAENPMLLCAVVIDEPANAESGGAAAAPLFKKIMTQIISHPQLEYAERILHPSEMVGKESGAIAFQGSKAEPRPEADKKMVPYACANAVEAKMHSEVIVPKCVGMDLRDAVNALNVKGLAPFVIGAGTVWKQSPISGTTARYADACTLNCSFEEIARN